MEKTAEKRFNNALVTVLSYFPSELTERIRAFILKKRIDDSDINEIRIRSLGVSALVSNGRNIPLDVRVNKDELKEIFRRICGGAVFAHRDDVCRGFVTLDGGIRVGVCGFARYESGNVVGVGDVSALVFRIPGGSCSFARELYQGWSRIGGGMLICSGAGEGKTTAIRALARLIGSARDPKRVVIADERCEFNPEDYREAHVDVLRGYKRALGVDIAIRTMSAEVLIVDEISSAEDASAMLMSLGAGVTVIATVHAHGLSDAMRREYVKRLVDGGLFESVCVIKRSGGAFSFSLDKIDDYLELK